MYYRLLLSVFFLPVFLTGQNEFAPPGAEWCLQGYDADGEALGYVIASYVADTLLRGQKFKVLQMRAKTITPAGYKYTPFSSRDMVLESGDSVFYYIPNIGVSVFLFKKNYIEGEVTTSYLYNDYFDVLSVKDEIIDGLPLSVAELNLQPWLNRDLPVTMYGRWGPSRGFIGSWGFANEGKGKEILEAVRADSVPEVKMVARSQCFAIMDQEERTFVPITPEEDCKIEAFPNPVASVDEWVRIRLNCRDYVEKDYRLLIYDTKGRVVGTPRTLRYLPNDFSVRNLPNGRYFALLIAGEERYEFTFLKSR
ncbi:MAG: hypothetical protein AAGF89_01075 [Bacteroidota bacterium]